ncbi:MAG: Fic family protein [Acidobacteriota bacterium]|nr:Fic family protein [Acidobacteriota bacterium]
MYAACQSEGVASLAVFHHRFLKIHPFLDGNGRVARVLSDQAADELSGTRIGPEFSADPESYYGALKGRR